MGEKNYEDIEQEFWEYKEENDAVSGIYLSMQTGAGENKSNVYNLEMPNRKIMSIWGSTVLDNKMKLVKFGDDIKIIYLGEKSETGKGSRRYKDFKIQRAKQIEE